MPIYEYRCKKCDHLEEILQNRNDPAPAKCPECNARKSMSREMSLTSFQLKGGGWYADGYADSNAPSANEKPAKKADKKPAKKAKPAAKTKKKAAKTKSGQAA